MIRRLLTYYCGLTSEVRIARALAAYTAGHGLRIVSRRRRPFALAAWLRRAA